MYPNSSHNAPYPPYPQQQPPAPGFGQQQPQVCPFPPQQPGGYPSPYPQQTPYPQPGYPTQGPPPVYGQPSYGQAPGGLPYPPTPYGQPAGYPQAPYPPQQQFQPAPAYPSLGGQPQYSAQNVSYNQSAPAPAMQQQYQDEPSIKPVHHDPQADAQALRKAMKGLGTDEKAIISVLTKRTDPQRQAIAVAFKSNFGKDLIKDLKSELGGKLEDVILALMTPRVEYLAQMLHKAISGLGTKESLLVDILCTASNHEIREICATYQRLYKTPLEKDLKGDTSGHFMRLLVSICTASRSEDPYVNQALAAEDANKLLQAGEKKWGTDESMFNMILATRSYPHLRMVFHEYERLTGHSFERAIEREFSGDVETGMMAIVKCAKNRAAYFAKRLNDSMKGMGTKDNDLIFLMVSRADIDLGSVAKEYHQMFGKSLANDISGDTSGDYKKVLLGILGM